MEQTRDTVRIRHNHPYGYTHVEVAITVLTFMDDEGYYIAYCPSLDLSDYGKDEEEAKRNFDEMLSLHFATVLEWGTLARDLKRHGWEVKSEKQKKVTAPSLDLLKKTNPIYKGLIDSGTNYKITRGQRSIQQATA